MSTVNVAAMTWEYRAVDATGTKRSGTAQGKTEQEIYRQLTAMGLTPVSLRVAALSKTKGKKIGLRQLSQLTGQLSVLVSARMSISEGLYSIGEQETDKVVKAVVMDVASRVAAGETIAESLQQHPRVFNEVYIETVRAAEKSGNLPDALEHLADMLERSEETRRAIKGALTYPVCVIAALCIAVVFLVAFVVPKFAKMFSERGVELPFFTTLLQKFGDSMTSQWYFWILGAGGAIFAARWGWSKPAGKRAVEVALHKIPYMKAILVGLAMQRFAQVLGVSIKAGIGLIDSLELAGRAASRPMLTRDVDQLIAKVRTGGRLGECLPACRYITPFAKRMIIAGESSAELPRMCGVVAKHYERETSHLTKNISTIIEPILIVLITGVVLVIALAIFMPMWNMVQLIGG